MTTTSMIHVRVDENVKSQATAALEAMGLSVADAVRILLTRIAAEKAIPFEVRVPNAFTLAAMKELEEGRGEAITLDELSKEWDEAENAS